MILSNKHLLSSLAFVAVGCSMSACVSTESLTFVEPSVRTALPSQLSVLRLKKGGETIFLFAAIFDEKGRVVMRDEGMFTVHPTSVKLPSGRYEIVLHAFGGYQQRAAFPRVVANVAPGKTYDVAAFKVLDGRAVSAAIELVEPDVKIAQ